MIEKLKAFWLRHGQKTIASALGALALVDLTPYADDLHAFFPWPYWHPTVRLVGAAAIFWRATQATRQ